MATEIETKIMEAMFARLGTLALNPAVPIAWPNVNFDPGGEAYLRPTILTAQTSSSALAHTGTNQHRGILQVDVFSPVGQGSTKPSEIAGAIIRHFKRGTVMEREGIRVKIDQPPFKGAVPPEPSWFQVPVSIPYLAFVPNA